MTNRIVGLLLLVTLLLSGVAQGQAGKKAPPDRPEPTAADYAYGHDSERQKFDFWQAKSDKPTPVVLLIHGGGWMGGDKTGYGTGAPFSPTGCRHLGRLDQLSLHSAGDGAERRTARERLSV